MTVEQKSFKHDGSLLAYHKLRRGGGTFALVMIHGLASNSSRWSEFIEHSQLRPTWDFIAVDLRGHGASVTRCRQSHQLWASDLQALLQHEGYQQAIVIGHSLGAQVAIHFAHRYPQMSRGLVLIEPVLPDCLLPTAAVLTRLRPLLRLLIGTVRLANRLGLHRRNIPVRDLYQLDQNMRALIRADPNTDIARYYARPLADLKYVATVSYLQDWHALMSPLPPLESLTLPILALLSQGEQLSDRDKLMQHLTALPKSDVRVFDANHWLLTEMPQATRKAIEAWCAEQMGVQ